MILHLKPVAAKTWSPSLNDLTSLPTDSISPASSCPNIFILVGLKRPIYIRMGSPKKRGNLRTRASQSHAPHSPMLLPLPHRFLSVLHCPWESVFLPLGAEEHPAVRISSKQLLSWPLFLTIKVHLSLRFITAGAPLCHVNYYFQNNIPHCPLVQLLGVSTHFSIPFSQIYYYFVNMPQCQRLRRYQLRVLRQCCPLLRQ